MWSWFWVTSLTLLIPECDSFLPPTNIHASKSTDILDLRTHTYRNAILSAMIPPRYPIGLFGTKDGMEVQGTGRGLILFTIVMAGCIWLFSIPPEFRRAHFCIVERCVQERSKCYNCVTFSEWTVGVQEYYRGGGGVEFDFTVADETKAFWKDAVSK